jgi:hypothetical protein
MGIGVLSPLLPGMGEEKSFGGTGGVGVIMILDGLRGVWIWSGGLRNYDQDLDAEEIGERGEPSDSIVDMCQRHTCGLSIRTIAGMGGEC